MDQHVSEAEDGWIEMQRQADDAHAEHLGLHPAVSLINDDGDWVSVEAYKALEAEVKRLRQTLAEHNIVPHCLGCEGWTWHESGYCSLCQHERNITHP